MNVDVMARTNPDGRTHTLTHACTHAHTLNTNCNNYVSLYRKRARPSEKIEGLTVSPTTIIYKDLGHLGVNENLSSMALYDWNHMKRDLTGATHGVIGPGDVVIYQAAVDWKTKICLKSG